MNLNEFVMNHKIKPLITADHHKGAKKTISNSREKPSTTFSSDTNWGKSHISIPNSSNSKKSVAGSSKISNEETDSRVIVALTEGRGEARYEVGIAAISVSTPLLILCQISDTQNYNNTLTKLNIFNPNEILFPNTLLGHFAGSRLIDTVKQRFPNVKYVGVPRSTYNKVNGMEMLSHLCIPNLNGILLVLQHRYYALAASCALLTYIQENFFIYYAGGSIKIVYQESEGYAIIDVSTADRLELVCSTRPAQGNKYASLFGVLNHCQTKIGARTLRSIILQPPCDVNLITDRLNCVDELAKHPEALSSLRVLLQKLSNIDSLLSIGTLVTSDPQNLSIRQLNYVMHLNSLLELIDPLKEVIIEFEQPFFVQLRKTLENKNFIEIKNLVRKSINENVYPSKGQSAMLQRCFAIKPGINGLLDLVRKTYTEIMNDMKEYVKTLAEKYDLAFTLGNNQTKGPHIILYLNSIQRKGWKKSCIPEEFIEIHRSAGCFTMKTPELVNFSTRLDDIMKDILKISNVMVHSIISDIKKHIFLFHVLCEDIAQLDVLQSLATVSVMSGYVRPHFGGYTRVTHSQHPLLDFLLPTKPVANSIACSDDYNIHVITGPNGSGKSIFIRQVLLLQVMAQVSCYVPAQSAVFKPADRIFARIYLEDDMEYGASSFILEMKEIKYIMTTMTENSLIVIDELGRSTSLEEGTALAIATLENLANSSAYIYITSHFTLLAKLHDIYPNIKLWQMETISLGRKTNSFKLEYKYSVIPGVTSVRHYGIYLVRNIWPKDILSFVDNLIEEISKQELTFVTIDPKSRLKYAVESKFRQLKLEGKFSTKKINNILEKYQQDLNELGYAAKVYDSKTDSLSLNNLTLDDNDIRGVEERIKVFTPEVLTSNSRLTQNKNDLLDKVLPRVSRYSYQDNISFSSPSFDPLNESSEFMTSNPPVDFPLKSVATNSIIQESDPLNFFAGLSSLPSSDISTRTSTPTAQYLTAVCCYSPSSSKFSHCIEYTSDVDLTKVECSKIPLNRTIYKEGSIGSIQNSRDELNENTTNLCNQRYRDYVSPIIAVVEGMNDTTVSWREGHAEDENTKINIIADVTINKTYDKVPMKVKGIDDAPRSTSLQSNTNQSESSENNCIFGVCSQDNSSSKWLASSFSKKNISDGCNNSPLYSDKSHDNYNAVGVSDGFYKLNRIVNSEDEFNKFASDSFQYTVTQTKGNDCASTNEASAVENDPEIQTGDLAMNMPIDSCGKTVSDASTVQNVNTHSESCIESNEIIFEKENSCVTSLSIASKKRNLDQASSETAYKTTETSDDKKNKKPFIEKDLSATQISIENDNFNNIYPRTHDSVSCNIQENSKIVSFDSNNEEEKSAIFNEFILRRPSPPSSSILSSTNKSVNETFTESITKLTPKNEKKSMISKKIKKSKSKSILLQKLSAREIRKEFKEQDRKILESNPHTPNISKYLEQIINRPTIKQIQNSTQLALIRKHNNGLEVIPAHTQMKRKPKYFPCKKYQSNEDFNVSIFSDQNGKPFQEYLNSNERDYETFRSNRNKSIESDITNTMSTETYRFAVVKKNNSKEKFKKPEIDAIQDEDSDRYSQPSIFHEGNDINIIINKYLQKNSFVVSQQIDGQQNSWENNNIFDNNNLSNEDLLL
ncbi:uncharacterized protein isoform X2 [Leptinotarsa decemlineata]|uniref:uncharacterized protein isoform X2 n=1 Tax=Leptinotarsa decemlineata TaxID=7539 RepID=UPI003D30A635